MRHCETPVSRWCPAACRTRDGRRRELLSMLRCRPREAGSGFDALAFDGAVDRRAADTEELGNLLGAVLATVYQRDQVRLLAPVGLGLFAPQTALGVGDLHALPSAKPDQVGLEL